jgi:hypothetical protein
VIVVLALVITVGAWLAAYRGQALRRSPACDYAGVPARSGRGPRHLKKEHIRVFHDRENRRGKYARPMGMTEDELRAEREGPWQAFLSERGI